MRKLASRSLLITTFVVIAGLFFAPHAASAAAVDTALSLLTGGTDLFYGLIGKIFWWVLIPLGGLVLQLLGLVIDAAVSLSLDPSFYNSEAIGIAWSIVRDLANMVFIFVLIYEGIKTILNIGNLASVKRTIANVIIAALLLNFSLFFTKAMIDVSNVATAWFVEGITRLGGTQNVSLSKAVHSTLQMEKLTKTSGGTLASAGEAKSFSLQSFTQGVLLFALMCVAIYVFFQVTFLIVGRIVAFIFLLITAPIGFTGVFLSLGDLSTQASKWWKEMMQQLMMLPMFFLMLYLTLFMVDRFDKLVYGADAASTEFTPGNYLIFAIIIMMLLKALKVAEDYSSELGGTVAKFAKSATGVALGGIAGAAGALGRQTVGRTVFNYSQNKEAMSALQSKAAEGGARGFVGRMQLAATNKLSTSSFDARKSGVGGSVIGALGPKLEVAGVKIDAGKVGKTEEGGFKAGVEEFKKSEKEWAEKNLGKGKAGEENRMRYAAMRQDDTVYKAMNAGVAGKGYSSAFGDISDNAQAAYRKNVVEDAKKASTGVSNQIIAEQVAMSQLESAAKTNDVGRMNEALEQEKARMEKELESMKKKNSIAAMIHEEGSRTDPRSPEDALKAREAIAEKMKYMTPAEKKKTEDEAKKITQYTSYKKAQEEKIKKVMDITDVVQKKQAMVKSEKGDTESISDAIRKERIGQEYYETPKTGKGGVPIMENGKPVIEKGFRARRDGHQGLAAELQKKKADLKKEQAEFDAIEGNKKKGGDKGGGGGGGGGGDKPKPEAKPAEADDDDEDEE